MSEYFKSVDGNAEFRQGDILRRFSDPITRKGASWGFVINADCDIANQKNQGHISWLEIISTNQYWRDFWAPQQLTKFSEKQSTQICDQVNSIIKKHGIDVDQLCHKKLLGWIARQEPEEIVASLGVDNPNLVRIISAFRRASIVSKNENALDILEVCLDIVGQKSNKHHEEFKKAIVKQEGFPDFFLVPNIPEGDSKGYVVLLRRVHGSSESSIYKTAMEARINDQPSAFHRIGRFSDSVRFQIVQKMSFLFSRIGSSKEFENNCKQVIEWAIEEWESK